MYVLISNNFSIRTKRPTGLCIIEEMKKGEKKYESDHCL
mgnify:CR=1 FL=1